MEFLSMENTGYSDDTEIRTIANTYYNAVKDLSLLTREEEIELCTRSFNGDVEASQILFERNIKLVIYFAKKIYRKNIGFSIEDLIQVGMMALHKASKSFNPNTGFKFITYAKTCIHGSMINLYRNMGSRIKIPTSFHEIINKYVNTVNELNTTLNRIPDYFDVSEVTGFDFKTINLIRSSLQKLEDETYINYDYLDIEFDYDMDEELQQKIIVEKLLDVINNSNLTEKELDILLYFFRFSGSIQDLREKYYPAKLHVYYHKQNALRKMKKSPVFLELKQATSDELRKTR